MRICQGKNIRRLLLVIIGLVFGCRGIIYDGNPLIGDYQLQSMTVKIALNKQLRAESPDIAGDLTIQDTLYSMIFGLAEATGDSIVDYSFRDQVYQGRYEFIGSDSLRLHNMPSTPPYVSDWRFHRTAGKLTLDNAEATHIWTRRY